MHGTATSTLGPVTIQQTRTFEIIIERDGRTWPDLTPDDNYPCGLRPGRITVRILPPENPGTITAPDWVTVHGRNLRSDGSIGAENSRPVPITSPDYSWAAGPVADAVWQIIDAPWPELGPADES